MIAPVQDVVPPLASAVRGDAVKARCPQCYGWIGYPADAETSGNVLLVCANCQFHLHCEEGIWKALLPNRAARFLRFIAEYEYIRAAEGRGSTRADYYLQLPYNDITGNNSTQWAIRARTFRTIESEILPAVMLSAPAERRAKLRILDLGAGNGWMSYRLALGGHVLTAVDLLANNKDGLGAACHYKERLPVLFQRFQAELDNLPFADEEFDLAIFNASFHYSENYGRTLAEAFRCTRKGGTIVIADTAWYGRDESGKRMADERRAAFTARYGFPSSAIDSLEYLSDERLQSLEKLFNLRWRIHTPWYGIRWSLRPLCAMMQRKREPARFRIYTARVEQ